MWPAMVALVGNFTICAILLFVVVGLGVGQLLGGPAPDDRAVLALSTAMRHPGVAIGIAHASGSDDTNVVAAVLLAVLIGAVVTIPYVRWRHGRHEAAQERAR